MDSNETIVHCCLTCLCLSLHPFGPLEHIVLLFPRFPLLCKIAIMRWRIEVVDAQVEDSFSRVQRSTYRGCHYCISVFINRNIHFLSNTCTYI